MQGGDAKILAFFAVLSVVSAGVIDPPGMKMPPIQVVPPAPVNPGPQGPVPVIPAPDRTVFDPARIGGDRTGRAQFQQPFFGGSASQSGAFNFGGNVNIPGVGGFDINQSASLSGGFGFGGSG